MKSEEDRANDCPTGAVVIYMIAMMLIGILTAAMLYSCYGSIPTPDNYNADGTVERARQIAEGE